MLPDRSRPLRATAGSRLRLTAAPTRIKGRGRDFLSVETYRSPPEIRHVIPQRQPDLSRLLGIDRLVLD